MQPVLDYPGKAAGEVQQGSAPARASRRPREGPWDAGSPSVSPVMLVTCPAMGTATCAGL